tara:strand:+ start:601 stop:1467 length:867 start_codon:yes stop_codon:yes gene_type:complete
MSASPLVRFPYSFVRKIGEGGYGKVYKVTHKHSGQSYACKLSKKRGENPFHEVNYMLKLKDANNIVDFYECYNIGSDRLAIIMEECRGSNIFDALHTMHDIDERAHYRDQYILQTIVAIEACHNNGIIHKDIKHTNFILKDEHTKDTTVKLIDFGLSEFDFGHVPCKTCGTLRYMPPEGLQLIRPYTYTNSFTQENIITTSYDIWSLGIMIYLLYTGKNVFQSPKDQTVIRNIKTGLIHNSLQHEGIKHTKLTHLISSMLQIQPMMRPTIGDVHKFFLNECIRPNNTL